MTEVTSVRRCIYQFFRMHTPMHPSVHGCALLLHMGVRGASGLAFTSVNRYNQIWKGGLGVC